MASLATLVLMLAQQTDLEPGEIVISTGDSHLYLNHLEQVREQLSREPRPLPSCAAAPAADIYDYRFEDFELRGYDPHPHIPGAGGRMSALPLALVVAAADNDVIGRNNALPWDLPADLAALPAPHHGQADHHGAPDLRVHRPPASRSQQHRHQSQPGLFRRGCALCRRAWMPRSNSRSTSRLIDGSDELMVIGGAQIYALALPRASRLYLTRVHLSRGRCTAAGDRLVGVERASGASSRPR
jgi:hypothetical protein